VQPFTEGLSGIIAQNKKHAETILNLASGIDWSQG
jgi:hypothetical protein